MSNRLLLLLPMIVVAAPAHAEAMPWGDEKAYQAALCAGMELEVVLDDGAGRADCESETHIIEVDWAENFKAGIGQSLVYATRSAKIPGLILICRRAESLCLEHALIAEETFSASGKEATVWRCPVEARALPDCLERHIEARP